MKIKLYKNIIKYNYINNIDNMNNIEDEIIDETIDEKMTIEMIAYKLLNDELQDSNILLFNIEESDNENIYKFELYVSILSELIFLLISDSDNMNNFLISDTILNLLSEKFNKINANLRIDEYDMDEYSNEIINTIYDARYCRLIYKKNKNDNAYYIHYPYISNCDYYNFINQKYEDGNELYCILIINRTMYKIRFIYI